LGAIANGANGGGSAAVDAGNGELLSSHGEIENFESP
jgi:hypothetical protein